MPGNALLFFGAASIFDHFSKVGPAIKFDGLCPDRICVKVWGFRPSGEVPERLNGTVSKTVVGETPPRVRIPASPPF